MRIALSVAAFAGLIVTAALARSDFDDRTAFFADLANQRSQSWFAPSPSAAQLRPQAMQKRSYVVEYLSRETAATLGREWVPTALRIARVESGYRCDAKGPRLREGDHALGIGQVRLMSARALGYKGDAKGLLDCKTGVKYMLAHMSRCRAEGATTEQLMARCHVAGWHNFSRRMNRNAEAYARRYQTLVRVASIPTVPDNRGWLARGTTSILAMN